MEVRATTTNAQFKHQSSIHVCGKLMHMKCINIGNSTHAA